MMHICGFNRRAFLAGVAGGLACIAGAALSGCSGGGDIGSLGLNAPQLTRGQYGSLQFTLSTTKTSFSPSEEVPFVFTVTNTGTRGVEYGDAAPSYRPQIRQGGTLIWDPWRGGGFGAGYSVQTLEPGETRRFEFAWNQKNNVLPAVGQPPVEAGPGTYRVTAFSGMILEGVTDPSTQLAVDPMNIVIR